MGLVLIDVSHPFKCLRNVTSGFNQHTGDMLKRRCDCSSLGEPGK